MAASCRKPMKLPPQLRVLLVSLAAAPVAVLGGWYLMAISVHNGGILMYLGMCLVPGALVLGVVPHTPYDMEITMAAQFLLFVLIGLLHLKHRERWRGLCLRKQEQWLGQKWDRWFGRS